MLAQRAPSHDSDRERGKAHEQREQHPHGRIGEIRGLPFDDPLLTLGRARGGGEEEQFRAVRIHARRERRRANRDGERRDALAGRECPDGPAALRGFDNDDDHQEADARNEPGVHVCPEQEQRRQQPEPPAAGAQIRLGDPQRPADQRECEDLRSSSQNGLGHPSGERHANGEHHRPRTTKPAAQDDGAEGAPGDEPHEHGHGEEAADRGEGGEDGLRQPLVRNQRIAEGGVREQLAGGDLVVSDDPVAEPNVPPHIRIAQGIEAHCTGEDEHSGEQGAPRVGQPCDRTAT